MIAVAKLTTRLTVSLGKSMHDTVPDGFGCYGDQHVFSGADPYDILAAYGSLAGDHSSSCPAHCQPVWCRNIWAKQTPHSTMRVPVGMCKGLVSAAQDVTAYAPMFRGAGIGRTC